MVKLSLSFETFRHHANDWQVVAIFTMFCGLIVLSLPITIIGANFNLEYRELTQRKQRERAKEKHMEDSFIRQKGQVLLSAPPHCATAYSKQGSLETHIEPSCSHELELTT